MAEARKTLLVDGNIPAGKACPFLDECGFKKDGCPTVEKPKVNSFSCAGARLWDMIHRKV